MILESSKYIATPPGETIKEQLSDRGMKQKEFASRMGVSEKHVSNLLNGEVHLTPGIAERLELVLGIPATFWNKLEAIYQGKLAKVKQEIELEKELKLAKKYPYNQLAKLGIVPKTQKPSEKVINLCKFFEVSKLELIQQVELMPIACRKLSNTEKSTFAMLALAQYAKLKARDVDINLFTLAKLKQAINEIRKFTMHTNMDFEKDLIKILASCGIALIFLPQLSGSFLHGVSFYDENTKRIVVGISMRGKYADRFWFSLFHELAHVMAGHIYSTDELTESNERLADSIAADILIPKDDIMKFYTEKDFSYEAIKKFALSINTHEGIIIGRLQHDNRIFPNQFNQYKIKFEDIIN